MRGPFHVGVASTTIPTHPDRANTRCYTLRMRSAALFALAALLPVLVSAQAACAPTLPVSMTISSELTSTVASASIGFTAQLQNNSPAPVAGAKFAVNVTDKETGAVVDRFLSRDAFALLPSSAGKATFVWTVPSELPSGIYVVTAALVTASTTRADAYATGVQPSASEEIGVSQGIPQAHIAALSVNGSIYKPETPTMLSSGTTQVVAATLNGTNGPFKGTLTWRLYAATSTLADKPLDTKTESIELQTGASVNASYTLPDLPGDGYYLEAQLSDGRSNSYADAWLARTQSVFPELACVSASASSTPSGSTGVSFLWVGIGVVLLAGLAWELLKKKSV